MLLLNRTVLLLKHDAVKRNLFKLSLSLNIYKMQHVTNATAESGATQDDFNSLDLSNKESLIIEYASKRGQLSDHEKDALYKCIKALPVKAVKLNYFKVMFDNHNRQFKRNAYERIKAVLYDRFDKVTTTNGIRINLKTFKSKPLNCELWFNLKDGLK